MMRRIEGTLPPHITPFTRDEQMDEGSLRKLVHFWLDGGSPVWSRAEATVRLHA